MAGLREHGYVRSEKGHGGGWVLARPLREITLLDVHRALGSPAIFALELADDDPECLVEQAVNAALGAALREAEAQLLAGFECMSLSALAEDFEARMTALGLSAARHGDRRAEGTPASRSLRRRKSPR